MVMIVLKVSVRNERVSTLHEDHVYNPPKRLVSTKIPVCIQTIVKPGTLMFEELTSNTNALNELKRNQHMLENHSCLAEYVNTQAATEKV